MLKKTITPEDICCLLNELLKKDYMCIKTLISSRSFCNDFIINHPTVQVRMYEEDDKLSTLGLLGLINGFFGTREDGGGVIVMISDRSQIIKFIVQEKWEQIAGILLIKN